jgi:PH (Pleckstrin Homology) domain-containing protein
MGSCAFLFQQYGLRHIKTYHITQEGIRISYFRFISWLNIPFSEIAEIYTKSNKLRIIPYIGWRGNNRLWAKKVVLIKTKDPAFPCAVLTPDNPDEFVQTVKSRIEAIQKREWYLHP